MLQLFPRNTDHKTHTSAGNDISGSRVVSNAREDLITVAEQFV